MTKHAGTRVINIPVAAAGSGTLYLESKDIDFEKPGVDKYIDILVFDIQAPVDIPTFRLLIGWRNALKDAVNWIDYGYLDFNNPIVKIRLETRYLKVRLIDESPVAQWKLSRLDFYGKLMGEGRL